MTLVIVIIALALIFDYINGFHDAANSIATVVSTKVLTPLQAVLWAAVFNFAAFFIFKDHAVANTIGKTVIDTYITLPVILAGLIAAIFWNLLTWWYGIPSSSSHTLIGGFAGAAVAHAYMTKGFVAFSSVVEMEKIVKTLLFIFLAPMIGMAISMFISLVTIHRNLWIKLGIIGLSFTATWFMFLHFQQSKMEENLQKFFRVDKYKKEVEKNPDSEESKAKLGKATANYNKALPFLADYNKLGADNVAQNIAKAVSFNDLEYSKLKDIVSKTAKLDRLKKEAFYDESKKPALDALTAKVDSLKPLFKQHQVLLTKKTKADSLAADSITEVVAHNMGFSGSDEDKLKKAFKIDLTKDLTKEIGKADNSFLRYSLLCVILIFVLSYIYIDKLRKPSANRTANMFKKLQLLSSAAFSLGHGGNDAQKVMGIIGAALIANGNISDFKDLPNWVPLACYGAIGLGTLSGGWKIVKTMGTRITKVTPLEGVSAETAGAVTLFMTEQMGIPVSTTHTITGSIIGVGATKRLSAVRWGVTRSLLVAWLLTIPVSAAVAGICYLIIRFFM
ncbi:MAG: inorganic phosphate transporter [Sphingomonadales bacterium]|nr:inorganic phosphate transporter [Sphingomonadales bacterium]